MCSGRWWLPLVADDGLAHLFSGLQTILTPEEVADLLRVNKQTLYRWLNEGTLPGHQVGNGWRIVRDDLHEWMRQGSNTRRQPPAQTGTDNAASDVPPQESPDP